MESANAQALISLLIEKERITWRVLAQERSAALLDLVQVHSRVPGGLHVLVDQSQPQYCSFSLTSD